MIFSISRRAACKPHRCDDCNTEIPAGQRYRRCEGLWEGEWSTFKSHESCHAAVAAFYEAWQWPQEDGLLLLMDIICDAHRDELHWLREHHGPAAERAGLQPAAPAAQPPHGRPPARSEASKRSAPSESEDRPAGRPGGQQG